MTRTRTLTATLLALAALSAPTAAHAFCGFYVSGGEADTYNNATQVVLMRDGTRTTLSMQNNYQGPLADFAMVIPVPVVLMDDDVKTLDKTLFDKVDQLSAPRLVEYWEQDPCRSNEYYGNNGANNGANNGVNNATNNGGVVVEAEFKVGEYQIVILSADDSGALTGWLDTNDYNLPEGAGGHLQPYIDAGQYFFVAKVIADEVRFEDGRAVLSPLRFSYNSDDFSLPIRLGLLSAEDEQDLIVYIVARNRRYEAANYPNATIPTNFNVRNAVREDFGAFYNALFTRTLQVNPGAVITEYSWGATKCDPCPPEGFLEPSELASLGADLLGSDAALERSWVLTRLHARYDSGNVGEDIVFRAAEAITGGRERYVYNEDQFGEDEVPEPMLETGAKPANSNQFQGRYAIRHRWEGPVDCEEPRHNVWGGNPEEFSDGFVGGAQSPNTTGDDYRTQETELEEYIDEEVPELGAKPRDGGGGSGGSGGDEGCSVAAPATLAPLLVVGLFLWRRRS
jgi:hypothetical protein